MRINHHPDQATLIAYAAGALEEPLALTVASHIAWCPQCRNPVGAIEAVGGALLERIEESPLKKDALKEMFARIDAHQQSAEPEVSDGDVRAAEASGLPRPLARALRAPLDSLSWRRLGPGVSIYRVPLSEAAQGNLVLFKVAPGMKLPEHGHGGQELTLLLRGAYTDRFGRFAVGDIADHGDDVEHQPIVDPEMECICLVATEARMRFRSFALKILQPLIRM